MAVEHYKYLRFVVYNDNSLLDEFEIHNSKFDINAFANGNTDELYDMIKSIYPNNQWKDMYIVNVYANRLCKYIKCIVRCTH